MGYVEAIKKKIGVVRTESKETEVSLEKAVNTYLDRVLSLKKEISSIQEKVDSLAEYTSTGFDSSFVPKEDILKVLPDLKEVNTELTKFYISIRNTTWFYNAAKEFVRDFHGSIENLREISADLSLFRIELDEDEEYKDICNAINSL